MDFMAGRGKQPIVIAKAMLKILWLVPRLSVRVEHMEELRVLNMDLVRAYSNDGTWYI